MHRAPGAFPLVGEVADVRMYVGRALSDEEVFAACRELTLHKQGFFRTKHVKMVKNVT